MVTVHVIIPDLLLCDRTHSTSHFPDDQDLLEFALGIYLSDVLSTDGGGGSR